MAKNKVNNEGAFTKTERDIMNDNIRDVSASSATVTVDTNTTGATLTNITGMTTDVLEKGQYSFTVDVGSVCTTNGGLALAFKQNDGLTLSQIEYKVHAKAASSMAFSRGTTTTDQTKMLNSKAAAWLGAVITGTLTVATRGKIQLQMAQETAHEDDTSVFLGSHMEFTPIGVTLPLNG